MNRKAAISVTFCGLDENTGEFSSRKGHSRGLIIERFSVGLQSESQGYMCLEKTRCYYIIILGVLGTESEGNVHTHR